MKIINWAAFIFLVVGGVNWGLVGFFNYDLVSAIFGNMTALSRTVFALVGVSAIYLGVTGGQMMNECMPSGKMMASRKMA